MSYIWYGVVEKLVASVILGVDFLYANSLTLDSNTSQSSYLRRNHKSYKLNERVATSTQISLQDQVKGVHSSSRRLCAYRCWLVCAISIYGNSIKHNLKVMTCNLSYMLTVISIEQFLEKPSVEHTSLWPLDTQKKIHPGVYQLTTEKKSNTDSGNIRPRHHNREQQPLDGPCCVCSHAKRQETSTSALTTKGSTKSLSKTPTHSPCLMRFKIGSRYSPPLYTCTKQVRCTGNYLSTKRKCQYTHA